MLHPDYPLPDLDDPVMRPFWDGCRAHELRLQREHDTAIVHWPPKPTYWKDGTLAWFVASGHGRVYSYVVGYEPFLPAFQDLLPHIMVLVELAEGPRLVGYMVDCRPEDMHFELPVRVVFHPLTERVTLPVWQRSH